MYQTPISAHGFNHQSFYRQPVSNLRQINDLIYSRENKPQRIQDVAMHGQYPVDYANFENENYALANGSNGIDFNNHVNGLSKLPPIPNTLHQSMRQSRSTNVPLVPNQDRLLIRQSSEGAMRDNKNIPSQEPVSLATSRSTGAIYDHIQRERRSHTMAPLARITGPSTELTTNMFASTLAPSDAQTLKSSTVTQARSNEMANGYSQSNGNFHHAVRNGHSNEQGNDADAEEDEEDEDEDDDAPIIVKVQYDPDEGGPPSEDVIRQAVDNQLKGQSNQRNGHDPIVLNFLNQPTRPQVPAWSNQSQQPMFNRAPQAGLQSVIRQPQQLPASSQQLLFQQQQRLQLQEKQRQQQQLLQLQEKQRQQQQQQMQFQDQQRQQQIQLQEQQRQQHLLQLQEKQRQQQQLQLQEKQRQQLQLQEKQRQQQMLQLQEKQRQQKLQEQLMLQEKQRQQQLLELQEKQRQQQLLQLQEKQRQQQQEQFQLQERQRQEQLRLQEKQWQQQQEQLQLQERQRQQQLEQLRLKEKQQQQQEQMQLQEKQRQQEQLRLQEKQRQQQEQMQLQEKQRQQQLFLQEKQRQQQLLQLQEEQRKQQLIEQPQQQQPLQTEQQTQQAYFQEIRKKLQADQQEIHQLIQRQLQLERQQKHQQLLQQQQRQRQQELQRQNQQGQQPQQFESTQSYASLPPMGPRPSRTVPSMRTIAAKQPPMIALPHTRAYPIQPLSSAPTTLANPQQIPTITIQKLPSRAVNSALATSSIPTGLNAYGNHSYQHVVNTFIPIQFTEGSERQYGATNNSSMSYLSQNLLQRPHTAPSFTEMFRPSSALDTPELSKETLSSMLDQIPDLRGCQFNIEYLEPDDPAGYPIPTPSEDINPKYPEAVVVDKLPNNIIQHVRSSSNTELKAALDLNGPPERPTKSSVQPQMTSSKLKKVPSKVIRHASQNKKRVDKSPSLSLELPDEEIDQTIVPSSK